MCRKELLFSLVYFILQFQVLSLLFVSVLSMNVKVRLYRLSRHSHRIPLARQYLTVNILLVGKKNISEKWITHGCEEYEKRLSSTMKIETKYFKSDEELIKSVTTSRGVILALDETGEEYTSRAFSKFVYNSFEIGGSHITFVLGGFNGLPNEIKQNYSLLSLSKMTWTHQMARLLLIEQIYRASEIYKNSCYHKD